MSFATDSSFSFCSFVIFKALRKLRLKAVRSSTVHTTAKLESGTTFYNSSIARYSFCGCDCEVSHASIGSFTSIANNVVIGGGRHPMDWVGMSPVFYEGRDSVKAKFSTHKRPPPKHVHIGHDVWVGRSAIILPGVTVGNGAVIGAGSIVTKSIPPYGICAGNPSRLIRFRFSPAVVAQLEETEWWTLSEEKLSSLAQWITDPARFISEYLRISR